MTSENHTPALDQKDKELESQEQTARISTSANINAALVVEEYTKFFNSKQEFCPLVDAIGDIAKQVGTGSLSKCESMLMGQALALQSIFVRMAIRANNQEYIKNKETFLRLALKAQNQCRTTIETLANIKNPPVVYAKQANIAAGHQQVNNGVMSSGLETPASPNEPEKTFSSNELLSESNNATMDIGREATTSTINSSVETVG